MRPTAEPAPGPRPCVHGGRDVSRSRRATHSAVEPMAGEQQSYRPAEDPEVEPERAVLDVIDVELDPLFPRDAGAAVDLRPACQSRLYLEPAALVRGVGVDLGA